MGKGSANIGHITVDGVAFCPILVYDIDDSVELHEQVDNTTGGKKARIVGNTDFSATIEENNRSPTLTVGQEATIEFDNGEYRQVEEVIVERRTQSVPITEGTPVTWTYTVMGTVITPACSSSS
jgi:hypothetical protein